MGLNIGDNRRPEVDNIAESPTVVSVIVWWSSTSQKALLKHDLKIADSCRNSKTYEIFIQKICVMASYLALQLCEN